MLFDQPECSSRLTAVVTLLACIAAAAPLTAQDRPLTADFPEVYRAGGLNAPDWAQFSGGGPVGFDGAGNLYILDTGAPQVVLIDAQGQLVRTIGRSGEGPGEFGFPFKLVVWRDGRFAVEDLQRDAIHVFGPGGEFDHSVTIGFQTSLTTLRPDPSGDALYAQGSSRGSRITDAFSELVGGETETPKDEIDDFSIGRIDLSADVVVPDLVLRAWRAPREDPPEEISADDILDPSKMLSTVLGGAMEGVFFEPTLRWDVLPDGAIAYADSSAYAVKVVTADGEVVGVLQRPIQPEAVSRRLRSAAVERHIERLTPMFERIQGGDMPDDFRDRIEARGFYPEVSVIREIRSTWEGGLWIQRSGEEPRDDQGPIDVFGPDRQYVGTFAGGTVEMPEAFGPDGVVAFWERDELDVPSIVVKRLPGGVR